MKTILSLVTLSLMLAGCTSYQEWAGQHTEQLRQMYPAGMSRDEIHAKWDNGKPDFFATRPLSGWENYSNQFIAGQLKTVETTTGKKVSSVERYWGPSGLSSLAYCWYYYDSDSKLIDVEWQYKSD